MGSEEFRPIGLRDEPILRHRNPVDGGLLAFWIRCPFLEVNRSGKRREEHELREREVGLVRQCDGRVEGLGAIARQSKDE